MAIKSWWSGAPQEIYWLEIATGHYGSLLQAPRIPDGHWSYELVSQVRPGDRILHWNERRFAAWSEALSAPEVIADYTWKPRGAGAASSATAPPRTTDGWQVELSGPRLFEDSLKLNGMHERLAGVMAVRQQVVDDYGSSAYFPFYVYGGDAIRAQQGYLLKFPEKLFDVFPELEEARTRTRPPKARARLRRTVSGLQISRADVTDTSARSGSTGLTTHEQEPLRVLCELLRYSGSPTAADGSLDWALLTTLQRQLGVVQALDDPRQLLQACLETASLGTTWLMPSASVDAQLRGLVDAYIDHGLDGTGSLVSENLRVHSDDDLDEEGDPVGDLLKSKYQEDAVAQREGRRTERAAREGQDLFRRRLTVAYQNRCAVTGWGALDTMDAAHIIPYSGGRSNVVTNGLLLRTDIHRLFDRGLLAIDPSSMRLLVADRLADSPYADLEGSQLLLPKRERDRPDARALDHHRRWARL